MECASDGVGSMMGKAENARYINLNVFKNLVWVA